MNITIARLRSNVKYLGPLETVLDSFFENYIKWMRDHPEHNYDTYNVSFENGKLRKWIHKNRRSGRPRMNWTEETINDIWNIVKRNNERYRFAQFDEDNQEMIDLIKAHTEE